MQYQTLDPDHLTQENIDFLNTHFLVNTVKTKTDFGLIFGSQDVNVCRNMAEQAAKDYHNGHFPYIYVSGGPLMNGYNMSEAEFIADHMRKAGVPDTAIILEPYANNTQENLERVSALFNASAKAKKAPSATTYGYIASARRFMMTTKRRWPELTASFTGIGPRANYKQDWHLNATDRKKVVFEFNKLARYLEQDFLREVEVDKINEALLTLNKNAARKTRPAPKL